MSVRADFYLIAKPRFIAQPLVLVCKLAQRAYETRQPTLILVRSDAQADELDQLLWEFDDNVLVPHQIAGDDAEDALCPVLIVAPGVTVEDRPLVINLRDECAPGTYARVLEVVPADPAARDGSRERWRQYVAMGHTLAKHDM